MDNKNPFMPPAMWDAIVANWMREPEVLARLREATQAVPNSGFQIDPDQGQLMTVLTKLIGAKRALEVGVFTGYSSICVALGLPDDGRLVACDVSEEYTSLARRFWAEAGVDHKIELHLAPASETLEWLLAEGHAESFDMAFIDADKPNYPKYVELCLALLRPGGMLLIDNVFWNGAIADPTQTGEGLDVMRQVNASLHADERVDLAVIPIADGLTIARKR